MFLGGLQACRRAGVQAFGDGGYLRKAKVLENGVASRDTNASIKFVKLKTLPPSLG
jgi:hypothetical protein